MHVDPSLMEFISRSTEAETESKDSNTDPGFTDEDSDESAVDSGTNVKGKSLPSKTVLPEDKVEAFTGMDLFDRTEMANSIADDLHW